MSPETIGALLPLFAGLPLLVAGILITTGHRLRLHAVINIATIPVMLAAACGLVSQLLASAGRTIAHPVALWPAGTAIPFAADMCTAVMLALPLLLTIVSIWFAQASRAAK